MQFVHIADNHLGYRQYNLDDREEDIYNSFISCIKKILEIKPDVVLHSGDLFNDLRPPVKALRIAMQAFKKLHENNIKVYIVGGNHEMPKRKGKESPLSLLKDYVKILNGKDVINVDGEEIFICGTYYHVRSKREQLLERLKSFEAESKNYKKSILMLHQGINPYLPFDYELEYFDLPKFSYYALGHVHNRVLERFNDGILAYSGSTEIIYRNEYEDYKKDGKGFYLVDFSGGDLDISDIEKINVDCRDFVEVNVKDQKTFNEALNKINNCKTKPVVFGKVKREFKTFLDFISGKVLVNKIVVVDDELVDIQEVDVESIDIKKVLLDYAKKQKLDGNLVLNLYKSLINDENWKELLDNYYKTKF
ncbi:DNA repair exonuclease [Methanocaldococcus fervens]|uniref:DNA double-strand break repair protein Mre11 n=1 Tax=Methanocaldococcus fervens (strain DSM 4213 / JCM 15782 / AG86) TaxID=573064 RepID=C7P7E9_METFA|nr:exonuclease SbcCD subunit D [Methanocaldococcus fervens]ACV24481.1 metallophosphoesterase [Methanocaldococcus fervens AG86]